MPYGRSSSSSRSTGRFRRSRRQSLSDLEAASRAMPRRRSSRRRVGWVTSSSLDAERATFRGLPPPVAMRVANVARWIDADDGDFRNELYRRDRRYDVVVFVKAMSERHREEAERARAGGARVVFDANVNYYEIWGDYDIVDTRPTEEQQRQAKAMTRLA